MPVYVRFYHFFVVSIPDSVVDIVSTLDKMLCLFIDYYEIIPWLRNHKGII